MLFVRHSHQQSTMVSERSYFGCISRSPVEIDPLIVRCGKPSAPAFRSPFFASCWLRGRDCRCCLRPAPVSWIVRSTKPHWWHWLQPTMLSVQQTQAASSSMHEPWQTMQLKRRFGALGPRNSRQILVSGIGISRQNAPFLVSDRTDLPQRRPTSLPVRSNRPGCAEGFVPPFGRGTSGVGFPAKLGPGWFVPPPRSEGVRFGTISDL